jgi:hypothetical protein
VNTAEGVALALDGDEGDGHRTQAEIKVSEAMAKRSGLFYKKDTSC